MTYEMDIAGLKRDLPLCKVSDDLYIGAFVMFGDVELTVHCAAELLKLTPEYDYLIAPEAKAIPLVYEMARQSGADKYFVARKKAKAYMSSVFQVHVKSITTQGVQTLVLDQTDAELIHGKRIVIVDDVISTGESLRAMEELVNEAGGIIVGKMAVLAEGDANDRPDITVLGKLPLFNPDGTPWPMLARLGGSQRMRGYYQGRYTDNDMITLQIELRQRIWRRIGCAVWGGAGNVFPSCCCTAA